MSRPAFKPVKRQDPELPKAAIARLIDQAGGAKNVCIAIGRSLSQTYAYADQAVSDEMTFAQVVALTAPTATAGAEYLSLRAGGVFVPIAPSDSDDLGAHTAESIKQSGEACAEIVQAMADGVIEEHERPNAIRELDEAIRALVQLRSAIVRRPSES
ncbi:MAG: hypothetical protein IKE60_02290 [Reyranella sp.]|uniref:phage regulatory CII family protein n=1 Tax=Reyranella sp. TaxID=1929291 RepID=UPI0025D2A557|nr:phage regulatory CII family protein [Reyranella sp.]MBR2813451.1 hypothetical protein [Reyranella sp.]